MLKDIYEITNCDATVKIRIFHFKDGILNPTHEDVILNRDNIDHYNEIFAVDCLVPQKNELLIEGTID